MPRSFVVLNRFSGLQTMFESIGESLGFPVHLYSNAKGLAADLNSNAITPDGVALLMITGSAEHHDPGRHRETMKLLQQFNSKPKFAGIPVLFLAHRGDADLASACAGCGISYLPLPAKKSDILAYAMGLCRGPEQTIGSAPITTGQKDQKAVSEQKGNPAPITIGLKETGTGVPPITIGPKAQKQGSEQTKKRATESERRLATVMFADISGFTAMSEKMDPEEVTRIMNQCFAALGGCIERHGGHIDKFIGDCVMVLFGVPAALENAPIMALNTAIDMRNSLYQFNKDKKLAIPLDIHIGINTGMVLAGVVGSEQKMDYTVMGDTVNLASRLEDASEKGQILVGPDSYRLTMNDFEYRALTPISLKGKTDPVPVYEVLSRKEKSYRKQPGSEQRIKTGPGRMIYSELVGRDEEMNELRFQVMKVIKGLGCIVTVTGEAGIGKSRLMAELKSEPAMKQVTLLEGRAVSMGRNLSFHPIIDLMKNWAGITEDDGEIEQFSKLDKAVRSVHPTEADEIIPFAATLMGVKLSGKFAERVKGIEGEALEKLIFNNIRELLIKGSELRPMVIYIEDLHWADTSSIELLSALFKLTDNYRILFILVFRPNYEETGDRILKTLAADFPDRYAPILIEPLTEDETAVLIGNLLNIRGLPRALEEQIKERSGGNPFFIEEVVRSFIDAGAVVHKGDSFEVTDKIHGVTIPLTTNEVLMSRIDRLDEETRNLVKTASVIGRNFFHKIITQVAVNVSDIDNRLRYLEGIEIIRERKRMDELEYSFKHALAQEIAYESLLIQKRTELHLHVAQAIEGVFAERLHEFYGMLAYHYSNGDNPDKAEEYMLKAGEEALRSSASNEALGYFTSALAIYRDKYKDSVDEEKLLSIEKNIAICHYFRGHYIESNPIFRRFLDHYLGKLPENRSIQVIKIGIDFFQFLTAIYFPSLKFKHTPSERDRIIMDIYFYRVHSITLIEPDRVAIEIFEALKFTCNFNLMNYPRFYGFLAYSSMMFSWGGISFRISKRILSIMKDKIDTRDGLSVITFEAAKLIDNFTSGNWNLWENFSNSILQLGLKSGSLYPVSTYIFWQINFSLHKGYLTQALELIGTMNNLGDVYENNVIKGIKYSINSLYWMKLRKFEEAAQEIDRGIKLAKAIGDVVLEINLYCYKSDIQVFTENSNESLRSLQSAFELFTNAMAPVDKAIYYQSEFRLYNYQLEQQQKKGEGFGFNSRKKKVLKSGRNQYRYSKKSANLRTEGFRMLGTFWWLCCKPKRAFHWLKKSINEGEHLGARLELSRTYFEIGKRLLEKPLTEKHARLQPKARTLAKKIIGLSPEECLSKAEAMFREMDLQWDLEQLANLRH